MQLIHINENQTSSNAIILKRLCFLTGLLSAIALTSCSKTNDSLNSDGEPATAIQSDSSKTKSAVDKNLTQLLQPSELDYQDLEQLNRSIAEDSENQIAYSKRASIYNKLKRHEDAIADLNKAITLDESAELYKHRAFTYGELKQYEREIADYNRALELKAAEHSSIGNEEIYRERGFAYFNLGQHEQAIADFERYRTLDILKKDSFVSGCLGSSYYYLGQYEKAIAEFTRAITEAKGTESGTFRKRGDAYYQLRQYEKAIEDYDRAISMTPKHNLNYESRAAVHRKLGNTVRAKQDLAKANSLYEQYKVKIGRYDYYCEIPPLSD